MRRWMLMAWATLLKCTGALWWAKRQLRLQGSIVVLMFHRVLRKTENEQASSLEGIVVGDDTFDQLSAYVANNFQAVDAGTALPWMSTSPLQTQRLRVSYTFDDGWRDNHSNALPILRKYAIPATVFVCPGLVGENLPFWPERMVSLLRRNPAKPRTLEIEAAIERWKHQPEADRNQFLEQLEQQAGRAGSNENADQLCDWRETKELAQAGIRLGSHTQNHELLTMIPLVKAESELRQSKAAIEQAVGSCTVFAYPNGDWSPETRQLVAEAGFDRAFTTQIRAWTGGSDPLTIPRVNIYDGKLRGLSGKFSPALFEYTVFWRAWRAMTNQSMKTGQAAMTPGISAERSAERAQ